MTYRTFINGEENVCDECVGDAIVSKEIGSLGTSCVCNFCGANRACISLSYLASLVDGVYRELARPGELERDFSVQSDQARYRNKGEQPSNIVSELISCEPRLSVALVGFLSEQERRDVSKGDDPLYDNDASYEFSDPSGLEYEMKWLEFSERIKHENRFFDPGAKTLLDEIFEGIGTAEDYSYEESIITIDGKDEDPRIFRGRIAKDDGEVKKFCRNPITELSAPPIRLASPGRMNPAGIRMFYGATDPETCLAELRCAAGEKVVTAEFRPIRALRLLNLSALGGSLKATSYFDPDFQRTREQGAFLKKFQDEVSRPIRESDESIDYIPTQAVAEYLSKHLSSRIDGLMFRSSRIIEQSMDEIDFYHDMHGPSPYPEEGANIALFHSSCEIESGEELTSVTDSQTADNECKSGVEGESELTEMISSASFDSLSALPERPPPALVLLGDSVTLVEVQGVSVSASHWPISYLRKIKSLDA